MRKNIVAGNWKMNLLPEEGVDLVKSIIELDRPNDVVSIVCPSFTHLHAIREVLNDQSQIHLGAQDCSTHDSGAYTGQISAPMLKSLGAEYVILGHSERRAYQGESDELIREKTINALHHDLQVIYCCGETEDIRIAGNYIEHVLSQIKKAIFNLEETQIQRITIAYEPVWAIGTGKVATPDQAQEMHAAIRKSVANHYGEKIANSMSILYGGSCKPSNAKEIFSNPDVDGGLIGGAALKPADFVALHHSF
ncbi:MAG: triose-phosphate isomerase [Bacteroidia bacterium]|nr:triose-phosphate isomerase [Bacteroidia bacterium]